MIQCHFRRNFNSTTRISEKLVNLCQAENCRSSSSFFSSLTWHFLRSLAKATDHIDLVCAHQASSRPSYRSMLFFIFLLALANVISATPNVVLPVNSQLPPVARISQTFSFIFADSTFASSGTHLTYSLSEVPGWLHLDSSSRTLYGTPGLEI